MPTYAECPPEVRDHVETVMSEYRPDLASAGVTISCLIATSKPDKAGVCKPCLKQMGLPTVGRIKVTSQEARVAGQADAVIHLDWSIYPDLPLEQQDAVLHGLIYQLELAVDEETGAPLTDDCCRPKLSIRPPDFLVCGHDAVLKKHGRNALCGTSLLDFSKRLKQLELTFAETIT